MYYGSPVKIMYFICTFKFIVYVAFSLALYGLYKYLIRIEVIRTRPFLEGIFSNNNVIRRCLLLISTCTQNFLEAGSIKFAVILICQIYQGKLYKRLLFFSSCFILFNY